MKYLKVQQDLLKMADARDSWKHRPFNVPWFQADEKIWVCFDSVICLGIPYKQFYLNREQIFKDALSFDGGKIIEMAENIINAEDTKTVIEAKNNGKKMKLHIFQLENDSKIYINDDFMKYFDSEDIMFGGISKKNPLFVYEHEELVGIIFPVNHNEDFN